MKPMLVLVWAVVFSTASLAAHTDLDAVDQLFAGYQKAGSPGCSLGVIRDGGFIYSKGYGSGSLELDVPLSTQSVFYMASVSKQFTAASVVLAAEQGFLSLDDDIHKTIPELRDYGQPITLRQMLHHTSGFRDYLGLVQLSGRNISDVHTLPEMMDLIVRQKALNFSPGAEFLYSNTNYFLLAEVIKRATHKPLSVFAEENIFRPLGMSHTLFYDDKDVVVGGRVPAYGPGKDGSFKMDWSTNFDGVGDGGLMSSVEDLLLWDRNFYENKLGKGTLLKEMQTRGILTNGRQIEYALGLNISSYRGLPIVEHGGALFGYRTEILRFPEQRFTVICLCNLASAAAKGLALGVADVFLKEDLQPRPDAKVAEPAPGTPGGSDIHALAGKYENRHDHSAFQFSAAGDSLQVFGMTLKPVARNRFVTPFGPTVEFEINHGRWTVKLKDGENVLFEGTRIDQLHLGAPALKAYAGEYKSSELDTTYTLTAQSGSLMLHNGWNTPVKLDPLVPDEFTIGQLGTAVFHRDAKHHISGLSVYSGRIRDVGFERIR